MAIVNRCKGVDLEGNTWCLSTLFGLGEGDDVAMIPVNIWSLIKKRWSTTETTEGGSVMVLASNPAITQEGYIYNEPTPAEGSTIEDVLFPENAIPIEGLYFDGNPLLFSPTIGNAITAEGVKYQSSKFGLKIGSSQDYDALVQYLQSKAWVAIKLSSNASTLHVYGGPRGYFPVFDEVSEMMFSGNNDTKGQSTVNFQTLMGNYAIEYVSLGADTANQNALSDLMGYIQTGACLPAGVDDGQ